MGPNADRRSVVVVGGGIAGLFAALTLAEEAAAIGIIRGIRITQKRKQRSSLLVGGRTQCCTRDLAARMI